MKDYEIYDGSKLVGLVNMNEKKKGDLYKNSIIESNAGLKYKSVDLNSFSQKYELEFIVDSVDDLYDIVKVYINDDKKIFDEIEVIKKYNDIKNIKKGQIIKLYVTMPILKYFNKSISDVDKNSLINSKIYFITKVSDANKDSDLKNRLDIIINDFKNIINSEEYSFYDEKEKNKLINKAIGLLDNIIKEIESSTNYIYGEEFIVPLKIK